MKQVLLILSVLFLAWCASSLSSSETSVIIDSKPSGQNFTVTNAKGKVVHAGTTPETVMLNNSSDFFKPEVHKLNINGQSVNIEGKMTVIYYGNIFGLVGFIVDPITGAMWNLPDEVMVEGSKLDVKYSPDTLK